MLPTQQTPAAQETLGSMLNRLNGVIANTNEHIGVADKISVTTREAVERLGFINPTPPSAFANGAVCDSAAGKPDSVPTSLQQLDSLISHLVDANARLMRVNEGNSNVRVALEGQV